MMCLQADDEIAAASVMENLRLNTLEAQNVKIELVC
uniref:Uncharacterized protein n=1 Tax=Moniliophthora roreri TaxID=221103 RepID=A0A0W0G946_MONRR